MVANRANADVKTGLLVQPLIAPDGAQDLMLHSDDEGSTYLYVERQQGAELAIYDVTDPAHVKLDASIEIAAPSSYDFVSAVGNQELIVFRDGSGSGIIDLRRSKAPRLTRIAGAGRSVELLGERGDSGSSIATAGMSELRPRSVQVVEAADAAAPRVVGEVANVTKQVARMETGTTFLLGRDGVTEIRQMDVERQYEEQLALWNSAN
jgi:hypothetical protein